MKRGLIEWNPEELSREVLDGRVARCQALLAERGLDAAVCYTSVAQPGLSRYFVHFLPYWNEGVLVIPRDAAPMLCVGLSNRVFPWIKSSSTLTEIRASRNLGADAARVLQERGARRVGLADRGSIPHRVIAELESTLVGGEVVDLPQVVQTLALGLDPDELRLRTEAGRLVAAALAETGHPERRHDRLGAGGGARSGGAARRRRRRPGAGRARRPVAWASAQDAAGRADERDDAGGVQGPLGAGRPRPGRGRRAGGGSAAPGRPVPARPELCARSPRPRAPSTGWMPS